MTYRQAACVLSDHLAQRTEGVAQRHTDNEVAEAICVAVELLERNVVRTDMESIIQAVIRETGVTMEELECRSRDREYAEARSIACWLAYHYANVTLTAIGRRFNRNHSSMWHCNKNVDSWLDEPRLNLRAAKITTKLIREIEDNDDEESD